MARIGSQTPTQSAIIPYTETKGNEAARLYALTGRELMERQQATIMQAIPFLHFDKTDMPTANIEIASRS